MPYMDLVTEMHCLFAIKNLYTLTLLLRFRKVCNVGNVDVIALDKRKNRFFLKNKPVISGVIFSRGCSADVVKLLAVVSFSPLPVANA